MPSIFQIMRQRKKMLADTLAQTADSAAQPVTKPKAPSTTTQPASGDSNDTNIPPPMTLDQIEAEVKKRQKKRGWW
jgi:hypothetical protein